MDRHYYVYILTNRKGTVLYTGVTGDLCRRVEEHRKLDPRTFAGRYRVTKLVYYEQYSWVHEAIAREKQIKAGSRKRKVDLISKVNSKWLDLADQLSPFD